MKNTLETPKDTLAKINRRVSSVSADFERGQSLFRRKLRFAIRTEVPDSNARTEEPASTFGSAWLPGPLSYPWLLMFAGVPRVIEHLLRQI